MGVRETGQNNLRCVQEFSRNEPEKKGGREVKTEGVRMGKEG